MASIKLRPGDKFHLLPNGAAAVVDGAGKMRAYHRDKSEIVFDKGTKTVYNVQKRGRLDWVKKD